MVFGGGCCFRMDGKQREIAAGIHQRLSQGRGVLFSAPTGTGKTRMSAYAISESLRSPGGESKAKLSRRARFIGYAE